MSTPMLDLCFLIVGGGFLALCWSFVKACDRL
jgi:hypothetical protein